MVINMKKNIKTLGAVLGFSLLSASMTSCFTDIDTAKMSDNMYNHLVEYNDSQSKKQSLGSTTEEISQHFYDNLKAYNASESKKDSIRLASEKVSNDLYLGLNNFNSSSKIKNVYVASSNKSKSKNNSDTQIMYDTHSKKQTTQNDVVNNFDVYPNRSSNKQNRVDNTRCNKRNYSPYTYISGSYRSSGFNYPRYSSFRGVSPMYSNVWFSANRSRINHGGFRQGPSFNAFVSWNY